MKFFSWWIVCHYKDNKIFLLSLFLFQDILLLYLKILIFIALHVISDILLEIVDALEIKDHFLK